MCNFFQYVLTGNDNGTYLLFYRVYEETENSVRSILFWNCTENYQVYLFSVRAHHIELKQLMAS